MKFKDYGERVGVSKARGGIALAEGASLEVWMKEHFSLQSTFHIRITKSWWSEVICQAMDAAQIEKVFTHKQIKQALARGILRKTMYALTLREGQRAAYVLLSDPVEKKRGFSVLLSRLRERLGTKLKFLNRFLPRSQV